MTPTRVVFTEKSVQVPFPVAFDKTAHADLTASGHVFIAHGQRTRRPWNYPDLDETMRGNIPARSAMFHAPEADVMDNFTDTEWLNFVNDLQSVFFDPDDYDLSLKNIARYSGRYMFLGLITQRARYGHFLPAAVRLLASDFRNAGKLPNRDGYITEDLFLSNTEQSSIDLYYAIRKYTYDTALRGGMIYFE